MTREQAQAEVRRLEGLRIALELSSDRLSDKEHDALRGYCDRIRELEAIADPEKVSRTIEIRLQRLEERYATARATIARSKAELEALPDTPENDRRRSDLKYHIRRLEFDINTRIEMVKKGYVF